MATVLGIDLGIASVGFALIDAENATIHALGSRIFEAAEHPKDGASLALPRRLARGRRRLVRRRKARLKEVIRLLERHGLEGISGLAGELLLHPPKESPWILRKEGLERKLTDNELARALYHIAKHRGFQSNRKERIELKKDEKWGKEKEKKNKETKQVLDSIKTLKEHLETSGTPTIGALLVKEAQEKVKKEHNPIYGASIASHTEDKDNELQKKLRNIKLRNDPSQYDRTVERNWLRHEVTVLLKHQHDLGQAKATELLAKEFIEIAFSQKPVQSSIDMVGYCELEPTERRAPKHAYSAEQFVAISRLANLRILTMGKALGRQLEMSERLKLFELAHQQKEINFTRARKELGIADDERFNMAVYRKTKHGDQWADVRKEAEKKTFIKMEGFHDLKKAIEPIDSQLWLQLYSEPAKLDAIARALSFFTEGNDIKRELSELSLPEKVETALIDSVDFTKTVDLSIKALNAILPHMLDGYGYAEACEKAGYHHSKKKAGSCDSIPRMPPTKNPVVDRSLAQARRVINAVIKRYGMPDQIHVELARDLGKSRDDRVKIKDEQDKFNSMKKDLMKHASELFEGDLHSDDHFMKYRLWKEQEGRCLYSGEYIEHHHLRDPLAVQIDHALPRSRSWDNSYSNKVLCFTKENQRKKNDTPFEYIMRIGGTSRWEIFETRVKTTRGLGFQKRRKLLMKDFDEKAANEFKERNLNDTRYMSRKLKEHIETSLKPKIEGKQFVVSINGQMTAMLRGMWGLNSAAELVLGIPTTAGKDKKGRENDLHHAVDAAVVACATQGMVTQVNNWNRYTEGGARNSGKMFPPPWEGFRNDLLDELSKVLVSRQPMRKQTGQGHDETILSGRKQGDKTYYVKKIGLQSLTIEKLAAMVDVEIIDGQPTGRNRRLYEVLKERLEAHGGKADKAFLEPIRMPTNDPSKPGPIIRGIRVRTKDKSLLPVRGGYAGQASMVRVDVYTKGGNYFLVPIYSHHAAKNEIPKSMITRGKPISEWRTVDETYRLKFSLHKNDYLVITDRNGKTKEGYYAGTDIYDANINIVHHASRNEQNAGTPTAKAITKYVVNIFGEKFKIKREPRKLKIKEPSNGLADAACRK